jgi:hypothetical protein
MATAITTPPPVPLRSDPLTFNDKAEALADWYEVAVPQFNQLATEAEADAAASAASAGASAASAAAALASKNASDANAQTTAAAQGAAAWVSGTTYEAGVCVWSPISYLVYRRTATGGGTTDPSLDIANWALAAASLPVQVTVTGTTVSASANGDYLLTNVAATTVTLPAAPADGATIMVTVGNGLATNVVNPNGKNINGEAGNMTINYRYGSVLLRYSSTLGDWRTR